MHIHRGVVESDAREILLRRLGTLDEHTVECQWFSGAVFVCARGVRCTRRHTYALCIPHTRAEHRKYYSTLRHSIQCT